MTLQVSSVVPRDGLTLNEASLVGRAADRLKGYRQALDKIVRLDLPTYSFKVCSDELALTKQGATAALEVLIEREVAFLSALGVTDARAD